MLKRRAFDSGKSVFECIKTEHEQVEPKFKVGDWLQYRSAEPFLVEEITEQGYINGNSCLPFEWENEIHLWTIHDAKDGNILMSAYNCTFIYNGNSNSSYVGSYGGTAVTRGVRRSVEKCHWAENINIHPSTKKEQDYLFQKMGEYGYIWDDHAKMLICSTNMKSK